MPELPEVQTVVNDLNEKVKGFKIVDFWTNWEKSIKIDLESFKNNILGSTIIGVERRAKNILIFLDNEKVILVHLKMTGHLLLKEVDKEGVKEESECFNERVNQYIHHSWRLEKSLDYNLNLNKESNTRKDKKLVFSLEFSDLRKFGKINLLDSDGYLKSKDLINLGMEPLSKDFSFDSFWKIIKSKPNRMIRDLLLDQQVVVGIGNIYVSEILFDVGVLAERRCGEVNRGEAELIFSSIKRILRKAIKLRGTSDSDYRDTKGELGSFQKVLKVYNREGKRCLRKGCGGTIIRKKIKQRSAFQCLDCQH